VSTPAQDGTEHKYRMQFSDLFSNSIQENALDGELSYDEKSKMLCAAISAGLRGLMLKQSLDSRDLIGLVLRTEKTVQVAVRDSAPIVIHGDLRNLSDQQIEGAVWDEHLRAAPLLPESLEMTDGSLPEFRGMID
jgi:hypothetical protein